MTLSRKAKKIFVTVIVLVLYISLAMTIEYWLSDYSHFVRAGIVSFIGVVCLILIASSYLMVDEMWESMGKKSASMGQIMLVMPSDKYLTPPEVMERIQDLTDQKVSLHDVDVWMWSLTQEGFLEEREREPREPGLGGFGNMMEYKRIKTFQDYMKSIE